MDRMKESAICDAILKYGKDIINSEVFKNAATETHHLKGTVLDHTINVCVVCMRLAMELNSRGIKVREKELIQAALCHDLGMVGRDEKYKDRMDAWESHPKESARIARELIPDLSDDTEQMILTHMWPVAGSYPATSEAMILCMADKYASMADWQSYLTQHKYAARIKERLDEVMKSSNSCTEEDIHAVILLTSDMHGNIWGYSYQDDAETVNSGMARL
ncbi:MAG: HD domain-containing protein, partial [Lachnospiraceae bacterium]|nr:HD domain-containing protein [Lachnospiraceae bacterium]